MRDTNSSTVQTLVRFGQAAENSIFPNSSAFKTALGTSLPWGDLFIRQGGTALTIGAATPAGSDFLDDHVGDLVRLVARAAGNVLPVEIIHLNPGCEDTGYRWSYRVPTLVVSKSGDWSKWREQDVSESAWSGVLTSATKALKEQIALWCPQSSAQQIDLQIENAGRPMVLQAAVQATSKHISVMSRVDVIVSSALRIEGAFSIGALRGIGYGRMFRDGYFEKPSEKPLEFDDSQPSSSMRSS